jgi:hypothetical protein
MNLGNSIHQIRILVQAATPRDLKVDADTAIIIFTDMWPPALDTTRTGNEENYITRFIVIRCLCLVVCNPVFENKPDRILKIFPTFQLTLHLPTSGFVSLMVLVAITEIW